MIAQLAAMLAAALARATAASDLDPVPIADVASDYVHPQRMVVLTDGRRLHLYCRGTGATTVLFDSGASDWSSIWALVQPAVARRATACTYDRAGLGRSDPAHRPSSPTAIVEDLHRLIRAANLHRPLVLVGHSLGGFNMKLYAATYPADVAGLVLVDPSEDRAGARIGAAERKRFGAKLEAESRARERTGFAGVVKHYDDCATAARIHDLDPASDQYKHCTDPVREPLGPEIAADRAQIQVHPAYQAAQASELEYSIYGAVPQPNRRYARLFRPGVFGNKPLIVLTHSIYDLADQSSELDFFEWKALHLQTAALSTRGIHRMVPGTHHNIEVDDPQAIITAVDEVVRAVERRR